MKKNERDNLAKSVGTELVGAANSTFFAMGAKWSEHHPNWKEDMPKRSTNENGLPKLYLCQILTLDMTFGYRYSYRVGFITQEGKWNIDNVLTKVVRYMDIYCDADIYSDIEKYGEYFK